MPAARSCQLRLAIMRRDFVISTWYQCHHPCPAAVPKNETLFIFQGIDLLLSELALLHLSPHWNATAVAGIHIL
jgi:hypothetical protein